MRTESLDRFLGVVGEVILGTSQLRTRAGDGPMSADLEEGFDRVERHVGELQRRVLDLRTTPISRVMDALPRAARQVAERSDKRVEVELLGGELELDRSILDRLGDPLLHLVRNAVDHGLESPREREAAGKSEVGHVRIAARREKNAIHIDVSDDGRGVDLESVLSRAMDAGLVHPDLAEDLPPEEVAALVFRPGVSTAEAISDISGRGVGMDAVRATIESLGGDVQMRTERGRGTTTTLMVPIAAAVQRVLLVGIGIERVALPLVKVERILQVAEEEIERNAGDSFALVDDEPTPVVDLAASLGIPAAEQSGEAMLVLCELRGERVALEVDRFAGQQEIYVKPVPELLTPVKVLAGLTILGDGSPVFLLDLNHLV